jgi:hypothetical protein
MLRVQVAVRAESARAAARTLTNISRRQIAESLLEEADDPTCLEALDDHPPLTVLLHAMDPDGTVRGQTDWVAAPKSDSHWAPNRDREILGTP